MKVLTVREIESLSLWLIWLSQRTPYHTKVQTQTPQIHLSCVLTQRAALKTVRLFLPGILDSMAPIGTGQTHLRTKETNQESHLSREAQLNETTWELTSDFLPLTPSPTSLRHQPPDEGLQTPSPVPQGGTPCWKKPSGAYTICLDFLAWYVSPSLIITLKIIIQVAGTY